MQIEKLLKALANRRRLAIVDLLRPGSRSVSEIAAAIKLSIRATSKHLQILSKADVIDHLQTGTVRQYRLAEPRHIVTDAVLGSRSYSRE